MPRQLPAAVECSGTSGGGEAMASSMIESVLQEKRVFPPSPAFVKQANVSGMDAYRKMVAEFERDFFHPGAG
jgi:hypothetical protein